MNEERCVLCQMKMDINSSFKFNGLCLYCWETVNMEIEKEDDLNA